MCHFEVSGFRYEASSRSDPSLDTRPSAYGCVQYQISARFLTRAKGFSYWTKGQYAAITIFWYKTSNARSWLDKYLRRQVSLEGQVGASKLRVLTAAAQSQKVLIRSTPNSANSGASVVNISSRETKRAIRLLKEGNL